MRTRAWRIGAWGSIATLLLFAFGFSARVDAGSGTFVEEFTTTTARDVETTAAWDARTGSVRLPTTAPSWRDVAGLQGKSITAVAFSPVFTTDRTIFVGAGDGISRSTDRGATWTRVASTGQVTRIALSPAFAIDQTGIAMTNGDGIWHTVNGGATWQRVADNSGGFGATYVTDRIAYAAAFNRILRSGDGGATWEALPTAGIDPEIVQNGDFRGIAVTQGVVIERSIFVSAFSAGVYRSADEGQSWSLANPIGVEVASATAIVASTTAVTAAFFDGVYRSTDGGHSWVRLTSAETNDLVVLDDGTLLLATAKGVLAWDGAFRAEIPGWTFGEAKTVHATGAGDGPWTMLAGRASGAAIATSAYAARAVAVSTIVDRIAERITVATITPTATTLPGTSIAYDVSVTAGADGRSIWEGPVMPGAPWTFARVGSDLRWRARMATADGAVTPSIDRIQIAFTTSDERVPPSPPVPGAALSSTTSIRWTFTDTATGETGFEIHTGAHGGAAERVVATTKPKSVQDSSYLDEIGLTPNVSACDRHAHAFADALVSAPSKSWPCAATLAAVPPAPDIAAVSSTSVQLVFVPGSANPPETELAMREVSTGRYVTSTGALGAAPTWKTWGAWGNGRVAATGLRPGTLSAFCALARNRDGVVTACSPSVSVKTSAPSGALEVTLVVKPDAGPPVPVGAAVQVSVTIANTGAAPVTDVRVIVPMPGGAAYVPSSITADGAPLTDAGDGDTADYGVFGDRAIAYRIPTIHANAKVLLGYRARIVAKGTGAMTFTVDGEYRPSPELPPAVVRATPATIALADPVAESLTVTAPADGAVFVATTSVVLRGTAATAGSVAFALDDQLAKTIARDASGAFAAELGVLPAGAHTLRVIAGSRAATVAFTIAELPALRLDEPDADDAYVVGMPILVAGMGSSETAVAIAVDGNDVGGATSDAAGAFSTTVGAPAIGAHVLTVRSGGAMREVAIRVVARPPPDVVRVEEPDAGEERSVGAGIAIRGRAPAAEPVRILVDGAAVAETRAGADGVFAVDIGPLALGAHVIRAAVGDAHDEVRITIVARAPTASEEPTAQREEHDAPTIRFTAPNDGATLDATDVRLEGRATGASSVAIALDGVEVGTVAVDVGGGVAMTLTGLAEGTHTIAGAASSARLTVRVIVPPPPATVTITEPPANATTNAPAIAVAGRGPRGAIVHVLVDGRLLGSVDADAAGVFAFIVRDALADGPHTIVARTMAGGVPIDAFTRITIDRTPPPAPFIRAVDARGRTRMAGNAFAVTLALRGTLPPEALADIEAILITVESDPVTLTFAPSQPEWSYDAVVSLAPGSHTVRVASRDRAGNVSVAAAPVVFDVPPPACADGVDNDRDTEVDFPNDADCTSAFDDDESTPGAVARAAAVVRETTVTTARAVVETTTIVARVTARAAERAATTVQTQVLDNPVVEVTTERIVVPTVAVAVVANTVTVTAATGFQLLDYLQYLIGFILQPARLFARRKRKGWGTVYASDTKRPVDLATVRLMDTATDRVVQTDVTDALGRFTFLVAKPGMYRMTVQHSTHAFPSTLLAGRREDAAFIDLYFGDPLTVTEAGAILTANIPIDAKEEGAPDAHVIRQRYLRFASAAVSGGGLACSIVAFGISPRPYVGALLIVSVALHFLFRRIAKSTRRPKSWGVVRDASTDAPLHLAIVRIFDTQFNKLLESAVTDRYGRYSFLVGKNVYYVTAQRVGYAPVRSAPIDRTKRDGGVIAIDLRLMPLPLPAPAASAPESAPLSIRST